MKLSVITINYNNKKGLEKTIASVIGQTFRGFEHIIIDGGSTDGSVEIIKQNSGRFSHSVSEADNGIYNAMNKGIKLASGEYLLFLNSGDYLVDNNILETVLPELNGIGIIYGDGWSENNSGKRTKVEIPAKLKLDYFSSNSLFHPSAFIKRELFENYGLYNESNKIVSDWEFFVKVIMVNNVETRKIPYEISVVEGNGISTDLSNKEILKMEVDRVMSNYFPRSVICLIEEYKKLKQESRVVITPPKKGLLEKVNLRLTGIKNKWKGRN